MAKIVRSTQKIFGVNAAQNQIAEFGSIKAGAPVYSQNVANIQTAAFEGGWSDALQDDYAPYRQDRNAVDLVTTSQLAYVFQEGLPEYDAGTTYYKGSWVKGNDGDGFSIYESLSDDNIGNALSDEEKWEKKSFGGGLEIGDIGIAPFGIDETKNKRRYLNGQVISQAQFVSFTNKLKSIIQTYPSLAVSETNWQATVTNSKLGQCGKFVIDDTAGTIRLPKVVNINGLQDLALMGSIKAESLPNIRGEFRGTNAWNGNGPAIQTGALYSKGNLSRVNGSQQAGYNTYSLNFDASRSSSTYQDNAPVQQEAVQYPYFIQVATGVEESVDVTREIELNNPFSLLDYKWSEYEITNASWLLSNGQFNSGATYISVYNLLLEIYNGTVAKEGVSVKLSTESFDDTDFVLNTDDTTFRLPIKVKLASGNAVVGNGMTLGVTNGANNFGVSWQSNQPRLDASTGSYGGNAGQIPSSYGSTPTATQNIGVTIDPTKSGIETSSSGLKLYFYVGETIQDANVIAASNALTTLADCVKKSSATDRKIVVSWGIPDYSAGVAVPNNYVTTFPCFVIARQPNYSKSITAVTLSIDGVEILAQTVGNTSDNKRFSVSCFVEAGHTLTYSGEGTVQMTVYPLKGVN